MNTISAQILLRAGEPVPKDTPVKVRGYLPCRLATGRPTKKGELQVVFGNGRRQLFPPDMMLFGDEDIQRGYAKA